MIANALPRPLTAGSVDNAILRADGTGGSTLQNSDINIDDAVPFLTVTGIASPNNVLTSIGNTFVANQQIFFASITGGSSLTVNAQYFVRDVGTFGSNTFRISATFGGTLQSLGSDITTGTVGAGQANVAIVNNHAGQTNSSLVLTPKGTGAFLLQKPDGLSTGGFTRGAKAVDLQMERSSASQVASGSNAFIGGGSRNTASGAYSAVCGGFTNTAGINGFVGGGESNLAGSQWSAICGGFGNQANSGTTAAICGGASNAGSGTESFIGGGRNNTSSATYSGVPSGTRGQADRYSMQAHAAGQFAANGDAQRARFVMRNKTTTNTAVELFLDGSSTRLTVPSGKIIAFTINIAGVSSTGGAVAHYMRQYCVKNVAGTTSEVYAPITIGTDNAAGTSIALSASDANDALVVSVTGTASTIWRWVASVDAVEIAYGI